MTYQEWIEEAKKYDKKAREAYDSGDERLGELYEKRASSCRYLSTLAPYDETNHEEN